jgi:hypothetical protein
VKILLVSLCASSSSKQSLIFFTTLLYNIILIGCLFIDSKTFIIINSIILISIFIGDIIHFAVEDRDRDHEIENRLSVQIIHYKIPEKNQQNDCNECTICMETFKENDLINKLECKHQFHAMCIQQWFIVKHTCPNCRFGESEVSNESNV